MAAFIEIATWAWIISSVSLGAAHASLWWIAALAPVGAALYVGWKPGVSIFHIHHTRGVVLLWMIGAQVVTVGVLFGIGWIIGLMF